jgi:hypothetical protein
MAHEILSVKLCELEEQFSRLSSRIQLAEMADGDRLHQEIAALARDCAETELTLKKKLRMSRAELVSVLSDTYIEVEGCIERAKAKLTDKMSGKAAAAEEKTLLAEYALDFAMQAADHALLLSMEAIDAQLSETEPERR